MQNEPEFDAPKSPEPTSEEDKDEVPRGTLVQVTWDYDAINEEEINLQQFDVVKIIRAPRDGWWCGEAHGQRGWFPSNFVRVLVDSSDTGTAPIRKLSTKGNPELRSWFVQYKQQPQYKSQQRFRTLDKKKESRTPTTTTPVSTPDQEREREELPPQRGTPTSDSGSRRSEASSKEEEKDFVKRGNIKWKVDRSHRAKWTDDVDPALLKDLSKEEKTRQEVIFELLKTERDYIKDIDSIIEVFYNPLRENKILPPKDLAVMFSNIEQIVVINQNFLKSLEQRREETPVVQEIGDLISKAVFLLFVFVSLW